jgi:Short C-terminal domain
MLARYLKAQLVVLVRGGVVGPIFLITYFLAPGLFGSQFGSSGIDARSMIQQNMSWMLWVGLLITIADVVVAIWLANRGPGLSAKSAALHQTGVLTLAQIRGLGETGMRVNDRPVVKMDLHIAGPGFAFDTQKRVTIDITKQAVVTRGKLVVVVDPTTQDYEIDWQSSGLVAGVVPAQFTSTEDNKTYDLTGQAGPLMEILQIYKRNNLPIAGTVDIRNYPAVRQQIMAVVRRAAAEQPMPAGAGGVTAPAQPSTGQRLDELQKLHSSGAISEAEYAAARQKIIADL